jgi:ankyrin repeat protein
VGYIIENDHQQFAKLSEADKAVLQTEDIAGWKPLHWAASLGRPDCISEIIKQGENVDVKAGYMGARPLHIACFSGKLDAFKTLLSHGAELLATFDIDKNTYLHVTASHGNYDFTAYLIKEINMDVNAKNSNGDSPLDLAQLQVDSKDNDLSSGEIFLKAKCAELLIRHGAVGKPQDLEMHNTLTMM